MIESNSRLKLQFVKEALKEFRKIDRTSQIAFKKKLAKLVSCKEFPSSKHALHGFPHGYYKIKLRKTGLRLVYHYDDGRLIVLVIAVGRRERNLVYETARWRLKNRT